MADFDNEIKEWARQSTEYRDLGDFLIRLSCELESGKMDSDTMAKILWFIGKTRLEVSENIDQDIAGALIPKQYTNQGS